MRLAEVTGNDGAVDGGHDLRKRYLIGASGQDVAATDPAFGSDQTGTLQRQEDLLQVGLGEAGALGDVPHRGRCCLCSVES
jgi:hypothetical protein